MARLPSGVRKRENGSFEKRFSFNGGQYSVTAKTLKELELKEEEKKELLSSGAYISNKSITLDKYFKEWLGKKEDNNSIIESTYCRYESLFRIHISPELGKMKICNIKKRHIESFQVTMNKKTRIEGKGKITSKTSAAIMALLKSVLNGAVNDEIIPSNPANKVVITKVKEKKATETYHRALTKEEQKLFMDAAKGAYYYELFAVQLATGMRIGELSSLTWKDVDYKNNLIHVTNTMTRTKNGRLKIGDTTKTPAGVRDIPLTETVKKLLANQREKCKICNFDTPIIFTTSTGKKLQNANVNLAIATILKQLENNSTPIEHFTSHALRDTYATRCIEQGMQPQTLKYLMGHESFSMTMDLYAHVLPNTRQEEMDNVTIVV